MIQDSNLSAETSQFLSALHHSLAAGEQVEIRYKRPGALAAMNREFFSSPQEAADRIRNLGAEHEIYVAVAPRKERNGTKAGVVRLMALWADLDAKDVYSQEKRLEQLGALHCQPSILVWSGGGFHAYWLLEQPAVGKEKLEDAELLMRRIAERLAGDPVHDRTRVMRVPGTMNHKYAEPRVATLEHCDPDLRYGLDQLSEMVEALPGHARDGSRVSGKVPRDILGTTIREGQRNVALASVAGSLRARGLDTETLCVVLHELNRLRCEPPLEDDEVVRIGRSIGGYPAGEARYPTSSARRVYPEREG